jgi:hypothetical protein
VAGGERAWKAVRGFSACAAMSTVMVHWCAKCKRELKPLTTVDEHDCFRNAFAEPMNNLTEVASFTVADGEILIDIDNNNDNADEHEDYSGVDDDEDDKDDEDNDDDDDNEDDENNNADEDGDFDDKKLVCETISISNSIRIRTLSHSM